MQIKALSLWQPWATWIAEGKKTIETRMWKTNHRGPLLICAARTWDKVFPRRYRPRHRFGVAVVIVDLVDCRPMTEEDEGAAMCSCEPGRFAWVLANVIALAPWRVRGHQRLFNVELPEPLYTAGARIIDVEKGSYQIRKG